MRASRLPLVASLLAVGTLACITPMTTRSTGGADTLLMEERAEAVFAMYHIPVAEHALDRKVRSGTFVVEKVWPGGTAAERVYCGVDREGNAFSRPENIELSITLFIRQRQVSLGSEGRRLEGTDEDQRTPCRLNPDFAEEILAAIVGDPADLRGVPGVELPGTRPPGTGLPGGS